MKKITKLLTALALVSALALSALPAQALSLSDYGENLVVDSLLRGTQMSATTPSTYYVALYTSACSDTGPGTEVSGTTYARQPIARSQAAWTGTQGTANVASSGTSGTVGNTTTITFPTATTNWGTVTYLGIIDAVTGGNMILCIPLTTPMNITTGSTDSLGAGTLTFQIDN